jgi:hypothetical protein
MYECEAADLYLEMPVIRHSPPIKRGDTHIHAECSDVYRQGLHEYGG